MKKISMFMMGGLFLAFYIIFHTSILKPKFLDITKHGYEQYQDIVINNVVVKPASGDRRECSLRYDIIKRVLDKYERPFTMLDIGASQGYYSFKTAHDYDSVCVMIEGNNPHYPLIGSQLLDLCKANRKLDNVILLNKMIVPEDLTTFSLCEHFDIVLAMNIIHWFGDRWRQVADAILNMGDKIIIETPPYEEQKSEEENLLRLAIIDYLKTKKTTVLGEVPRHTSDNFSTIYLVESNKEYIERKHWLTSTTLDKTHRIQSSYQEKVLVKQLEYPPEKTMISDWVPGINILTFKMYHGSYPTTEMLEKSLKKLQGIAHNDWTINNMILCGHQLIFVDFNDPNHGPNRPSKGRHCSDQVLYTHKKILQKKDPEEVEKYFWNTLVKTF